MRASLLRTAKALGSVRYRSTLSVKGYTDDYITVQLEKGAVQFSTVFLRDACTSSESVDASSKQKLFTTGEIINGLKIKDEPKVTSNGSENVLQVTWEQNGGELVSNYAESFLNHYATSLNRLEGRFFGNDRVIWNNETFKNKWDTLNVNFDEYVNNNTTFNHTVKNLNSLGISFINSIPKPDDIDMTEENVNYWPISNIAEKFGYIKKTFYGTLFDVKSVEGAKNIAYTNAFLPLHMDLLYYESPPGLQLLHAIDNSTEGGENIFCDSFLAAKQIRETDPSAYLALTQIPLTYHYNNDNEFYYYQRPLIVEDDIIDKRSNYPFIKEVNYSPPFQGPFEVGITKASSATENGNHFLFNDFLRGIELFEKYINDPVNHFEVKLPEGTCVVFDNRRVLHSRNEFSNLNGGKRWLMGCYVDGDSYRSKLRLAYRNSK